MEPEERRVGSIIGGKWRIDALMGSGSMAAVYAVTHRNGSRAALKILHGSLAADVAVCERFLGEGYLTNSVRHVGIVKVFDDGMTDDGCPFLAMDLLEGETLESLRIRRGGKIPLDEALEIGDQIMATLAAVHGAGIIHRDLKPQNVFVCNDGLVKLLDFGVARIQDRKSASKLSVMGMVLGTPSFMAPEQAMGTRDAVDAKSDIWAVGAILFALLTGETVHMAPTIQARLLAAATVRARSIRSVLPDLDPDVALIIDTSLQFKKEDRWENIGAMRNALERVLEVRRGAAAPPPPPARDRAASYVDAARERAASYVDAAPPVPKPPETAPYNGSVTQVSAPPIDEKTLIGMDSPSGTFETATPPTGPLPAAGQPARPAPPQPGAPLPPMRPQMGSNPMAGGVRAPMVAPTPPKNTDPFAPGTRPLPPGVPVPAMGGGAQAAQASAGPSPQISVVPTPQASFAPVPQTPQASFAPAPPAPQASQAPQVPQARVLSEPPQPFLPAPSAPGGQLPTPPNTPNGMQVAQSATSQPSFPDMTYPPPLDSSVDQEAEVAASQKRKQQRIFLSIGAALVAAGLAFGAVLVVKKGNGDPIKKTPGIDGTTTTSASAKPPASTSATVTATTTATTTAPTTTAATSDTAPTATATTTAIATGLVPTVTATAHPIGPIGPGPGPATKRDAGAAATPTATATETAPTPTATAAPPPTQTAAPPDNPLW